MPLDRLARTRAVYDGGVCKGCGVRLDATVCRCEPTRARGNNQIWATRLRLSHQDGNTSYWNVIEGEYADVQGVPV